MIGRSLGLAATALILGVALFEISMQPSAAERLELAAILATMLGVAAVMAVFLSRWAARTRSLRTTLVILLMAAEMIVLAGIALIAQRMFLSTHDLTLLMVLVGIGLIASLGFALTVSRPWTSDLRRVGESAMRIAAGDLSSRTGVTRADEVGRAALALDDMASRLEVVEQRRIADEETRRAFFAAIGHDLRSPIAALQAATEALRDGVAADPDRYLRAMERDIQSLGTLVDDLFLLARIESGSLEIQQTELDLTELADETIEVLRPISGKEGVTVRLEADERTFVTSGSDAVGRVMRNLLDNAIRHASRQFGGDGSDRKRIRSDRSHSRPRSWLLP